MTRKLRLSDSARGKQLRKATLLKAMYLCEICGVALKRGRNHPQSAVVDHIKPHKQNLDLFWDPDNLQAMCKECHDGRKASQDALAERYEVDADGWPLKRRRGVGKS